MLNISKDEFLKIVNSHNGGVKLKFQKVSGVITEKIVRFDTLPYYDQGRNSIAQDDMILFKDEYGEYRSCYYKNIIEYSLM